MESGRAIQVEAVASRSFIATTKEKALQARPVDGDVLPIPDILKGSALVERIFNADEKDQEIDGWQVVHLSCLDPAIPDPVVNVLQDSGSDSQQSSLRTLPAPWGLVSTIIEAYNYHHELILRPDDIWQAILTQFSFYVNAHAEALRDHFVNFSGKQTLVVVMAGSLRNADFGTFAQRMVDENIVKSIKDPEVASWLLPDFTTTTRTDRIVASVTVMGTLQAYFEYVCSLRCGIPKVTLEGTIEDWTKLRAKIDRLIDYDINNLMFRWHSLLARVLDQFVNSARGSVDLSFWDAVCKSDPPHSGVSYLRGWVTVFTVFTDKGVWQGDMEAATSQSGSALLTAWPKINIDKLPVGAVSVPVLVDDNGCQYDMHMVAGQLAHEICGPSGTGLKPRSDWCIAFNEKKTTIQRSYLHGEIRP